VDSTGKITYAPANLLLRSEEFDNASWTKTSSTVVANATTAPNGTLTADSGVTGGSAFQTSQGVTITSGATVSGSVYLKPNGINVVEIVLLSSSNTTPYGRASFNVATGVISTAATTSNGGTNVSAAITPAGDGWYRCSVTVTYPAVTAAGIRINATGATGGIFLWGAQFEQVTYQTTPGTYNATTSAAYYGPRFDYDPVTLAAKGLLIEEQRTNLMFPADGTTGWQASPGGSVAATANSLTSPDGTTNATKLATADTLSNGHVWFKTFSGAVSTTYSGSAYLKAGEYTRAQFTFGNTAFASTTTGAFFDLSNGTVVATAGGSTATITNAGNGWYRCTVTATSDADGGNYVLSITPYPASVTSINELYTPASVGLGIYLYGIQVEAGAFATSHIPTVASQVTRSADVATMTGTNFSSWYNQTQGTFVGSYTSHPNAAVIVANDGSFSNRLPQMSVGLTSLLTNFIVAAGSVVATLTPSGTHVFGTPVSVALAYAVNDYAAVASGGAVVTDTLGALPTGISQLNIGSFQNGTSSMNGYIRFIAYYNTRLPNAQLQQLTAPPLVTTLSLDFINGVYDA
jgi:hypothetical protein